MNVTNIDFVTKSYKYFQKSHLFPIQINLFQEFNRKIEDYCDSENTMICIRKQFDVFSLYWRSLQKGSITDIGLDKMRIFYLSKQELAAVSQLYLNIITR